MKNKKITTNFLKAIDRVHQNATQIFQSIPSEAMSLARLKDQSVGTAMTTGARKLKK